MANSKKPVLLMLAAHEPFDDPRIGWAARTAAQFFDVTVFGLHRWNESRPDREDAGDFRIVRFKPPLMLRVEFIVQLLRAGIEYSAKRVGLGRLHLIWYPLFLLGMAIFVPLEILVRIVADAIGLVWRWRPVTARQIFFQARSVRKARAMRDSSGDRASRGRAAIFQETLHHVFSTAQVFWLAAENLPDVAVVYCNDLDTLLPGVLLTMRKGTKLIYDAHEYWPYSDVEAPRVHVLFFRWMDRLLSRRADAVVTVSDPLAEELKRAYGLAKVEVVPNAEPWVERVAAPALPTGDIATRAAGRVSFLFQGNFAPQRGLEELIDAWTGVDTGKAALFLRGPDNKWRQALAERARRLGLLDRAVFILPPVSVAELVAAAREADVGVIPYKPDTPNYRVACPNKLSQYMHAGLAILSNNIGYVAGQIAAGTCGAVYDSGNRDSITAAVMKLAEDRCNLDRLKQNALAYGRDSFNWQVRSRPLAQILRGWTVETSVPSTVSNTAN